MNKQKIFNDPVYGFLTLPYEITFDIIEHHYFQRLRRICQLGLTHYVYPGALHTRFHHALGAMHLMTEAIDVLRSKNVDISEEEKEAACVAILLHDVGHGPFSHVLEHTIVNVHHEDLSVLFMEELNATLGGRLDMAIKIFTNQYPKRFLYQLISGQLDMDRMDYLNRDSFFTGVSEGVIGYDRIIKMLSVSDGELVVEEKGIYSIEKFLIARRLMYWQVYLHKTVLSAEQMLIRALRRAKHLAQRGDKLPVSAALSHFLHNEFDESQFKKDRTKLLGYFAALDDFDIIMALKSFMSHKDFILSYLANCLINRKLFKIELHNEPIDRDHVKKMRLRIGTRHKNLSDSDIAEYLVFEGKESNSAYSTRKDEIKILYKNGSVQPMSTISDHGIQPRIITKYYLCYPKHNH